MAKSRGKTSHRKTLTMGSKMAIATASCKKKGHKGFKKGSDGERCREKVAGGIERTHKIKPGKARRKKP